jgi:hypothetical protein
VLTHGFAPMVVVLAPTPREAGTRAAMWLKPVAAPLALPVQEVCYHVALELPMWYPQV